METTNFLVIFILFLLFQSTYGARSSNNTVMMASSNVTCIPTERHSLLVFRQGLKDESNRLSTWTGVECCEWEGVGCDRRNGHVVKLDLRSPSSFTDDEGTISINRRNWLKGKVSPSLLNLKHLRYLDLSMNNFSGQNIPEFFGCFKYLEYLNLSHTGFGGFVPQHLGNLSRLQYLDLSLNDFNIIYYDYDYDYDAYLVVDDLRWLSSLSSLKHLDLSGITIANHNDWDQIILRIEGSPCNSSICNVLDRLILAACVYNIWKERNGRLFRNIIQSEDVVIKLITEQIRLQLLSIKVKDSPSTKKVAELWNIKFQYKGKAVSKGKGC